MTPTQWHLLGNLRGYMAQRGRKLEPDPGRPRHLLAGPGLGYRFQPDEQHYQANI